MIYLLDLCCKAGGCSVGYHRAAQALSLDIHIVGVDIKHQKRYPYEFIQADAVEFIQAHGHEFTHIHASPPCQAYTMSTAPMRAVGKEYHDILPEITQLMYQSGKPGVIENVMQAPMREDLMLRGDFFGLKVIRKRKFEMVNWLCMRPSFDPRVRGTVKNGDYVSVFGHASVNTGHKRLKGFEDTTVLSSWKYAMGIDWMTASELAEAIPPHYTEWIGMEFLTRK